MLRVWIGLLLTLPMTAGDLRVGVSRIKITPDRPIFLSGYAARKKPSEGVKQEIWAKALAVSDKRNGRIVIVTTDLIGMSRPISERVGAEVEKKYGLRRAQLMINSSHTHSGPAVRDNLDSMFDLTPEQRKVIVDYGNGLVEKLVTVVGGALGDMQPAEISVGHGTGTFAINRRQGPTGNVKIGLNPAGPVDQDVPVFRVTGTDGKLRAVLFGYACHNTTLGGDLFLVNGDYAGYAQADLETRNPGVTAMFMLLCGGDANPNPRGTYELAEQHGKSLAAEVSRVMGGQMKTVTGPVRSAWQMTELAFAPHTRAQFEEELKGTNWYKQRRAEAMLKAYDKGKPITTIPYPVQAFRFGKVTLLGMGGEVVVDYALRVKKEFPAEDTIVAGYTNDVMSYIVSKRVLREGGYEPVDSHIYYGNPGPYTEDVEETIMGAVKRAMEKVGRKR
ncbi:MAG: neutral/alkaline non-lysosomal ceramidase N-terminal domain-containing protein [Acidobacteria bacterium]|nr:neutral/alkaline non-lysosomal ceramidase N-terminal domain-containing protein [Acidobacteriota bacterium]